MMPYLKDKPCQGEWPQPSDGLAPPARVGRAAAFEQDFLEAMVCNGSATEVRGCVGALNRSPATNSGISQEGTLSPRPIRTLERR